MLFHPFLDVLWFFVSGDTFSCLNIYNPLHPNIYSSNCPLHIFSDADMDDLFDNQDLLEFVIFALILLTLMCDSRVIL